MKENGFTLAEVLITLGVVGVISAMTLPSVIKHYQKQRTVSQLKKVYTTLNQALKMSEIDNDTYKNWMKIEDEITPKDYANKYFAPYLKVIKKCNHPTTCYNKTNPLRVDKVYGLVLNDGSYVWFREKHSSLEIIVDINGLKNPNKYGYDIFTFGLNMKGINRVYEGKFCSKTDMSHCAGKIIHDGWKIMDDYPW